ncbi:MAG: hypothetical protein AABZ12_03550 [Planctomycetota bacterium]
MSSYEEARARMIKQTRREILSALALMYESQPMGFVQVCAALTHLELPDESYVKKDLTYLCEKGYVRWVNEGRMTPWHERFYKLTASGKDIVDRIDVDATLEP